MSDVFVAWALREAGQLVGIVSALNEPGQLQAMDHAVERNAQIIDSWVQKRGGKTMMNLSLVGFFTVPAERCQELSDLVSLISDARTEFNFGVGLDVQEAHLALTAGQKSEDPVSLYTDDMESVVDDDDDKVTKSEDVSDEDPRVKILGALKGIQTHAPAIEALKLHNEPAYKAVKGIIDAMIHMARSMKKAEGEPQAPKKPKTVRRRGVPPLRFPAAPAFIGSTAGSVHNGKIKVAPIDNETGAPKKQGWNGVRAGAIMSHSGSAISSRQPNTE